MIVISNQYIDIAEGYKKLLELQNTLKNELEEHLTYALQLAASKYKQDVKQWEIEYLELQ